MNNKVSFLDKEDIVELLMQAFEAGTVSYLELARFSCEEIYDNFLNKKKQKELDYKLDFALKDLSPAQNTPDGYTSGMLVGGIYGDFTSGTTINNSQDSIVSSPNFESSVNVESSTNGINLTVTNNNRNSNIGLIDYGW